MKEYILTEEDLSSMQLLLIDNFKELVRCKDCKHRYNGETLHNCCEVLMAMSNWLIEIPVEDDWHCGSGERKRKKE